MFKIYERFEFLKCSTCTFHQGDVMQLNTALIIDTSGAKILKLILLCVCLVEFEISRFLIKNTKILNINDNWGSSISNFRISEIMSFKKVALY